MLLTMFAMAADRNVVKLRQQVSGPKPTYKCCIGQAFSLAPIKQISKKHNCTINDVILLVLAAAFKSYFDSKDVESPDSIHLCNSVNLRTGAYLTEEDVKLEN